MLTKLRRPLLGAAMAALVAAAGVLFTPAPAQAMVQIKVTLLYIYCHDESEAFSDEPFLEHNGTGFASWTQVDGGEQHNFLPWHQKEFWFEGSINFDLWEDDGHWSEDDYLGTFVVTDWDLNGGPQSQFVGGSGYGWNYELRYNVTES